ncbi:S8 family serine peptidase [Heyndrickxia sporothermodurans]|uniref:S8 family serine peptidase n=1 Tax=Heyndrickxia sporothermodurans TaxID=46224 RepID=UPI0015E71608|nr:S8 family serine peptidase [Heyndrickxia sporothermodurans]MED3650658.1 S8 family serine peptidase [Heyndrickxia sporothermodurans]MED3697422.1 S8 family serine peptidase [Heyndrickxia sporothermodurans]
MGKKFLKTITAIAATVVISCVLPNVANAEDNFGRIKASYEQTHKNSRTLSATINLSNVFDRQIMIKTKSSKSILSKNFGLTFVDNQDILTLKDVYIARVPEKLNYASTLSKLKNSSLIEIAEPNYIQEKVSGNPNDPYFSAQWHLPKVGAPATWGKIEKSKKHVVVAVLDSGVDIKHPDLSGQLLPGYNVMTKTNNVTDSVGHGTAVAGTIAAKINNRIGTIGVNPYAKILPIKVGNDRIAVSDSIKGIYYAISKGADIINMSYGGTSYSELEFDALLSAASKGITVVAASGNDGRYVNFPAAYPTVLSVGSTNQKNQVSGFSSSGPLLDVVAPGEKIITLGTNNRYVEANGTSFAAPIVSGLASFIKSVSPNMPPHGIEYLLEKGATNLAAKPNIWSSKAGYGLVNSVKTFQTELPNLKGDIGDIRSKAKSISVNKKYTNKYDLPLDSDWYKLKVTKTTKVKVELSGVPNMDGIIWFDKFSNGKATMETLYNKGGLGKGESFTKTLKAGTYYFQVMEINNHWSTSSYSFKVTKLDTTPPAAPKVNSINNKSTKLTGKAEKGAKLTLKKGSKVIATGKATSKSTFSLKIPKQKAGTVLYLTATDAAGNKSKATKITVKKADTTPPKPPKVNAITSKSTKLTGKAEKGAKLTLKKGSKVIATGKATSKSTFSLKIPKQKKGTILYLIATDAAGNKSKATKITVKK